MLYDITRTITPDLAVFPGDTPFSTAMQLRLDAGDVVNLTTLTMTAHLGTHADAPWHTDPVPRHPADLPLAAYLGPARVVTVDRPTGGITPADLGDVDLSGTPRLLLHTRYSALPDTAWDPDFPYPTPELADWLAAQGGLLLGVDTPSVDAADSHALACHHRLVAHGIGNLENLLLRDVPDGVYELIALPLKLAGVCGSPVRAVLRPLAEGG